ncbi:MAG: pentapeptide repeat-containing protein [Desulfofustis sp.]|nr:pentapeptide repeat-containing protein [Desulfofustis sp.]
MKYVLRFLVFVMLLILTNCSPITSKQAVKQESTQLKAEQIFEIVADNSLVMSAYDFSGTVYFDRNGQLAAVDNEKQRDVGKWDLTDENQLCLKFRLWYYSDIKCYTVYDNPQADRLTFFTTNGAAYYTAKQVGGDPESLASKLEKASPPRSVRRQIASQQGESPSPSSTNEPPRSRDVVINSSLENDSDLTAKRLAGNCPGCNMTGMDLREASLIKANLEGADLSGADLRYANLRRANLSGANLQNARLNHANLPGANLTGADLQGADLSGANLLLANLTDADVSGANFTNANLEKTIGLESTP